MKSIHDAKIEFNEIMRVENEEVPNLMCESLKDDSLIKNIENVNSKCEKNIKKYNQASRANSSRHSANTISAVFQPNISRG